MYLSLDEKRCIFYAIYFFIISLCNLTNLSIVKINSLKFPIKIQSRKKLHGIRNFQTCQTRTYLVIVHAIQTWSTLQYCFTHRNISFQFSHLLITGINLIWCHRTTLVLVWVHLHKSKVPVSFEKVGQVISRDLVNFCGLELPNFLPQTYCFYEESSV